MHNTSWPPLASVPKQFVSELPLTQFLHCYSCLLLCFPQLYQKKKKPKALDLPLFFFFFLSPLSDKKRAHKEPTPQYDACPIHAEQRPGGRFVGLESNQGVRRGSDAPFDCQLVWVLFLPPTLLSSSPLSRSWWISVTLDSPWLPLFM